MFVKYQAGLAKGLFELPIGFVPTKVRKVPQDLLRRFVLARFFLFLHLPFSGRFYAAFFGGKTPSVSLSFSSEKSYSPSMLI